MRVLDADESLLVPVERAQIGRNRRRRFGG